MLSDFAEHPGLLFVAATLLPLASFVLLAAAFGVWALARPYRETTFGALIERLGGGEEPGRTSAYVATGAVAAAFLLSLFGFVLYRLDDEVRRGNEQTLVTLEGRQDLEADPIEKKLHEEELTRAQAALASFKQRWSGRVEWIHVQPDGLADADRATSLTLGYHIDGLTALLFVMVTFIAGLIHLFSIGYMNSELHYSVEDHEIQTEDGHLHRRGRFGRFFLYLSLFCFAMLHLLLADNLFQVFVSWELVGVCSYLLIGFYYERASADHAAIKALLVNRVGDVGFLVGLMILWTYVGTLNIEALIKRVRTPDASEWHAAADRMIRGREVDGVFAPQIDGPALLLFPRTDMAVAPERIVVNGDPKPTEFGVMPYWALTVAGLGIFLGCVGKSAQFPLHVWLPDAMAGPTPVSALIHAATMVAAGVYLVGRCHPLFTPEVLLVVAYTGAITLFLAATIATVMTDIKQVLAYSTVSQLGFMMLALGVGGWTAGLFHLTTHAFFKALLFLGAGAVIHSLGHEQDLRKMGGLLTKMPVTAVTMLAGVFAVAGVPLCSGWYSKDAVLAAVLNFVEAHRAHAPLLLLPTVTIGLTAFYMFRLWFLAFAGKPRDAALHEQVHEPSLLLTAPLAILAVLSLVVAWGWPPGDAEASWLAGFIHQAQPASVDVDFGFDETAVARNHAYAQNIAMLFLVLGVVFAALIYLHHALDAEQAVEQFPGLYRFLMHKWYFDELYAAAFVRPTLTLGRYLAEFDRRVLDGALNNGTRGVVRLARWEGRFDGGIVDGLVNLTARVIYGVGASLRGVQTGSLRGYVLFLALAAVSLFVALTYFVSIVAAG